jgi:hypothetical protein
MLNLKAVFERKTNEFPARDCVIENIVELPATEYARFRSNLIRDADFIAENKNRMYQDGNGIQHCLLVLGENSTEGVLVQSEGYDYARYASLLPGARDFVTARLNELSDQLVREGTQNTRNGVWAVHFKELSAKYQINLDPSSNITAMLMDILETRREMAAVEPMKYGFDMVMFSAYCPNIQESPIEQEPEESGMKMKF